MSAFHYIIFIFAFYLNRSAPEADFIFLTREINSRVELLNYWIFFLRSVVTLFCVLAIKSGKQEWYENNLIYIINSLLVYWISWVSDYLSFYLLFEISLLPIFIVIAGWGRSTERINAGYRLFFISLLFGSPLIFIIVQMKTVLAYYYYGINFFTNPSAEDRFFISTGWWLTYLGFFSKLPIFGFHIWLPLAHYQAPLTGSILLAGIILKLGLTGMVRVVEFSSGEAPALIVIGLSLVGYVVIGLICCSTADIKLIVAYSSIGHIGLALIGILLQGSSSISGTLIIGLGHGFSSIGLFIIVDLIYQINRRKNQIHIQGQIEFDPALRLYVLILVLHGIGSPPTSSLITEITLSSLTLSWFVDFLSCLLFGIVLGRAFHLFIFKLTQKGRKNLDTWIFKSNLRAAEHAICIGLIVLRVVFTCAADRLII